MVHRLSPIVRAARSDSGPAYRAVIESDVDALGAAGDTVTAGPDRRSTRLLVLLVPLACLVGLAVLYLVAVHTRLGQRLDNAAIAHHHLDRTPDADARTLDIVLFGATLLLGPFVLWFGWARRRQLVVITCAVASAVLVAEGVRHVLPRHLFPEDPLYGGSYPSGHATAAMGLALAFVMVARDTPLRRGLVPVLPAIVAVITLTFPIHRPSDVVAGFALALGAMTIAYGLAPSEPDRRAHPVRHWPGAIARTVLVTAALLAGEALALRHAHLALPDLGPGFPIAVVAMVSASELTVAVFRAATDRR